MNVALQLRPLRLRLRRQPGPLRTQILAALSEHGQPLRWAITAVDRGAEAEAGQAAAFSAAAAIDQLTVEAVVMVKHSEAGLDQP